METMKTYKITSMSDVAAHFASHSVGGPLLMRWYLSARSYARTLTEGAAGVVDRLWALDDAKAACLAELSHYGSRGASVAVDEAQARPHDDELLPDLTALLERTPMLVGHDLHDLHDVLHGAVPADQVAVVFLPSTMNLAAIMAALVAEDGNAADYAPRVAAMLEGGQLMTGVTHFSQDDRKEHGKRWQRAKDLVAQRKAVQAE